MRDPRTLSSDELLALVTGRAVVRREGPRSRRRPRSCGVPVEDDW